MDDPFRIHNAHLDDAAAFSSLDPHLRRLEKQPLVHRSALLRRLPRQRPGIYTIGGGRQIGKTTLLKQWMADLLHSGTTPERIAFFTGELIDDQHALVRRLGDHLERMPTGTRYLLIDEVTYIRRWEHGIKFLADSGLLAGAVVVLSGSDLAVIKEARMGFPGRRGTADEVDFQLYPLSFAEFVRLAGVLSTAEQEALAKPDFEPAAASIEAVFAAFERYLLHGGFLTAINDVARNGHIPPATFAVYSDWIRGDVLKRRKSETYLREILTAIGRRLGSPISWNNLAQDLSIDHPATVSDYIALLSDLDVLFVQPALIEDRLAPAPKKPRKVMFADPFIHHAVQSWLWPTADPQAEQAEPCIEDPDRSARLVEASAACHVRRHFPTLYIRAAGEVDIAYLHRGRFWPIEVKWTGQMRPKDLKQIAKYPNGRIWNRARQPGISGGVPSEPLPLALLKLDAGGYN